LTQTVRSGQSRARCPIARLAEDQENTLHIIKLSALQRGKIQPIQTTMARQVVPGPCMEKTIFKRQVTLYPSQSNLNQPFQALMSTFAHQAGL
jgi:hypothetical protein